MNRFTGTSFAWAFSFTGLLACMVGAVACSHSDSIGRTDGGGSGGSAPPASATGGLPGSGGVVGSGGLIGSGGLVGSGGVGTGGLVSTGGAPGSGGTGTRTTPIGTGGATGGSSSTGGSSATGGSRTTGGSTGSGGGTAATGGSGGTAGAGGRGGSGTGGTTAMGGSSGSDGSVTDVPISTDATGLAELCLATGGQVTSGLCCASTADFPNSCLTGPCGCAPSSSHTVALCTCPSGGCFAPTTGCSPRPGSDAASEADGNGCTARPESDATFCGGTRPPHYYTCILTMLADPCVLVSIGDVTNTFCCP
jgi:hypothetical protein